MRGLLVASRGHLSNNGCISFASRAAESQSFCCVPQSALSYNNCVPVDSRVAGVKMEPVKADSNW